MLLEDAPSSQQGRGGATATEDPVLSQVSQHLPHQLTQVQATNHLFKPAGGKGGWTEAFQALGPPGPTSESPQGGVIFFGVPRLEVPEANGLPGDRWVFTQTPWPPPA